MEPEEFPDVSLDEDDFYEEKEDTEAPSVLPESVILPLPSNIISVKLRSSIRSLEKPKGSFKKAKLMIPWRAFELVWLTNLFYYRQISTRVSKALELGLAFKMPKARS